MTPRLLRERDAAAYLGMGTTAFRELGLPRRRWGRRVLYERRDLDDWVDRLPYEGEGKPEAKGCADPDEVFG